jgi:mercuric reductase
MTDNNQYKKKIPMTEIKTINLEIQGMRCESCANHVEGALKKVSGVVETNVPGWESREAVVTVSIDVDPAELESAVEQAGYHAKAKTENRQPHTAVPFISKSQNGSHIHLMVIGGGSAGFAAAIKGGELGYKVALVEAGTIGGTCVNVGCVPSKALLRAMEQYHLAGESRYKGVHTSAEQLDWPLIIADKDALVDDMRKAKYSDVLAGHPNVTYIEGHAKLTGGNSVEIDGIGYTPDKIIIATGASPWVPPIPNLAEAGYLTSTSAMELTELPLSMIVMGANAVGLEQAQIFARAGVSVTIVELLERVAPFEDEEISTALQGYLEDEGLQIITNFESTKVEKNKDGYTLIGIQNGKELTLKAEQLLIATGHRPNTAGMGLEESGVQLGNRGEIIVDETMQTANPDVYAAGDVTGRDMFVYVAAYAGGLAAENALTGAGRAYQADYIPRVTFTDPQVASAGLTESQAREQGYTIKISTLPMEYVPRALAARDMRGLIKLVADANSDRMLGAHFLAPEAGEIIQAAVLAIRFGITVQQLRETMFPYLTNVESLKLATLAFEKDVTTLSCCAG